jgi:tRNA nucleotidyltransferase (CCA-adding enzyme)
VRPFTTGKDLQALGLPPSPRYAAILSALKQAWLDGQVKSEVEEKVLLQKLLEKE